jgi:hypothetical protein
MQFTEMFSGIFARTRSPHLPKVPPAKTRANVPWRFESRLGVVWQEEKMEEGTNCKETGPAGCQIREPATGSSDRINGIETIRVRFVDDNEGEGRLSLTARSISGVFVIECRSRTREAASDMLISGRFP